MARRAGDPRPHPQRRLNGALKPGATLAAATPVYEAIATAGVAKLRVRVKITTAGTVDLLIGNAVMDQALADPSANTHTTGNPVQVALSANTEAMIEITNLSGEEYVVAKVVSTPGGAVTYVDVSTL